MNDFRMTILNGQPPRVLVNNKLLALVSCNYTWETCTDKTMGVSTAIVCGYLAPSLELQTFKLDFITGKAIELH